jgi:hypothetical protein
MVDQAEDHSDDGLEQLAVAFAATSCGRGAYAVGLGDEAIDDFTRC